MNDPNKEALMNEAFASLGEMLSSLVEGDAFGPVIDALIQGLINEGPQTFDQFRDYFPSNTRQHIMNNQAYKKYLPCLQYQAETPKMNAKISFPEEKQKNDPRIDQYLPKKEEPRPPQREYADSYIKNQQDLRQQEYLNSYIGYEGAPQNQMKKQEDSLNAYLNNQQAPRPQDPKNSYIGHQGAPQNRQDEYIGNAYINNPPPRQDYINSYIGHQGAPQNRQDEYIGNAYINNQPPRQDYMNQYIGHQGAPQNRQDEYINNQYINKPQAPRQDYMNQYIGHQGAPQNRQDEYIGNNSYIGQQGAPQNPIKRQDNQGAPKKDDISVAQQNNNNDDETTLEGVFRRLHGDDGFDPNFTLVYEVEDKSQSSKESIITNIVNEHKDSNFTNLFNAFKPFLFDLLKRRENFGEFIQILRRKSNGIRCQRLIKTLEVKDVLVLLLESCSQRSMAKLGPWLTNQYYPVPIFYPVGKTTYKLNLDCCLELMFQTKKMLITSIGTKNSVKTGKSNLLSFLFTTEKPGLFSTSKGFTHSGSVDLYPKLAQENFPYIIADVNGHVEDQEFKKLTSKLLAFSHFNIVHITADDAHEDPSTGQINMGPFVDAMFPTKSNFVLLFRDFEEDSHEDLISQIDGSLKGRYQNYHGIIPVPKPDPDQEHDTLNAQLNVLDAIKKVLGGLKSNPCWPIADIRKSYKVSLANDAQIEGENKFVREGLDAENKQNDKLYQKLFPCLWIDFLRNNEVQRMDAIDAAHKNLDENNFLEMSKKFKEIQQIINDYAIEKSKIRPSKLIEKICLILSSNDISRILLLTETINDWKMPLFAPIKQEYLKLCSKQDSVPEDEKRRLSQRIKELESEMDDKDVSLDTFMEEIHSLYEAGKVSDELGINGIKNYIEASLAQGAPINIVNGKTLKFGSNLLRELFENYIETKKAYVISIIGAQSSAKSTLLNVLFGCGFATSAGRCTKGLYVTLLEHPNGSSIIVIDTEGLLSVVARDHEFDNLITTMAFSCSHLVIVNNKGEIGAKLKDLLEICVFAMKHLRLLSSFKPKVIFALRDIADDNEKVQQEMLLHMKLGLTQAAARFGININELIQFSEKDVFLLPSAFQLKDGKNKSIILENNNLFSQKVFAMRNYIFEHLKSITDESNPISNSKCFYKQTEQVWNNITMHGRDIMKAKNFLEIELKNEAHAIVNSIYQKYDKIFFKNGSSILELKTKQLKEMKVGFHDDFESLLISEFNTTKQKAFAELDAQVINNERFAVISNSHREFKEVLEFDLGWQKQSFINQWKSGLIANEIIKNINSFKVDLNIQVNNILKNHTNFGASINAVLPLFAKIKEKSREEMKTKLEVLRQSTIYNLAPEIHRHFEQAQSKRTANKREHITVPTVAELLNWIDFDRIIHEKENWVKLNKLKGWLGGSKSEHVATISKEFNVLHKELDSIISVTSTEETASNIMTVCVEKAKKLDMNGVPVNFTAFMNSCLLEAMLSQFKKIKQAEEERIFKIQSEQEEVLKKEEKHIKDLLKEARNMCSLGETTARKCYNEILTVFCQEKEIVLQKAVMEKIKEKFPEPKSANEKAYGHSFETSNYHNVVKYVLNINKFIRELYDQEIKTIADIEINNQLDKLNMAFVEVIRETIGIAEQWGKDNEGKTNVDASTLFGYAQKKPLLKNCFPQMYILTISEVQPFVHGFKTILSEQLTDFDKTELKEIIYKRIEDYLNNQYQNLIGCQARCPVCHNKCTRADPNHNDHQTNCHYLSSFSGTRKKNSNKAVLCVCFDPDNYKCAWYSGNERYSDFDQFISARYPEWRKEFPTKDQPDKHITEISAKMLECWVATKDVLIKFYGYVDSTPSEWEKLVPKEKRLKGDLVLPGYNDVKKEK